MASAKGTTVFILGAGCSIAYGYPLASGFIDGLRKFLDYIAARADAGDVKSCVERTLRLIESCRAHYREGSEITTLDRLTKWIEEQYKVQCIGAFPRETEETEWPFSGQRVRTSNDFDLVAHKQVLDAKLATSAWFLHLEDEAFTKSLEGYARLLQNIFGTRADLVTMGATDARVLTFNYDRLFEVAFLKFFSDGEARHRYLYSTSVLNSGYEEKPSEKLEIETGQFCFLKLHGSVGWRVSNAPGIRESDDCRRYECCAPVRGAIPVTDSGFIEPFGRNRFEPLLIFPHEKHRGRLDFLADPYIDKIWKQAAALMSDAKVVKILGYSFDSMDRRYLINELFSKAKNCERVLVLDPKAPEIVRSLKEDTFIQKQAPQLLTNLVPCTCNFGERFDLS